MQTASQLVSVYVTLIKNLGMFADDGEMVRDRVQSVMQNAVAHIHLIDQDSAGQTIEEFRNALAMLLEVLQSDHAGSIGVVKLAISSLPCSNGL